jgi:hypothetical protein
MADTVTKTFGMKMGGNMFKLKIQKSLDGG